LTALIDIDQFGAPSLRSRRTGTASPKRPRIVHKTQSAVSMQMKAAGGKRLDRPIFARDGPRLQASPRTGERPGSTMRGRIVRLNIGGRSRPFADSASFSGRVRLGVPDDYCADR